MQGKAKKQGTDMLTKLANLEVGQKELVPETLVVGVCGHVL